MREMMEGDGAATIPDDESSVVTLTWHEVLMASEIGRTRQLEAIRRYRADRHGFAGAGWSEHIEGACGELAVAKSLGVYWDGAINTFSREDLPDLQVRTRSRHDYDLIVRPQDSDDHIWVLVTGKCPTYRVRGWIRGRDAKQPLWERTHGDRPPAYFVPALELYPMDELPRRAREHEEQASA